jgi:enolase
MKIKEVRAKKILNSKQEETIEITINKKYKASTGTGTSVGKHEVRAYPKTGIPVDLVNNNLNKKLKGYKINEFTDFIELENLLKGIDNTENLSVIGGDTVIALEYALLKSLCKGEVWKYLNPNVRKMPLSLGNVIGGGKHSIIESADVQEFLIMPKTRKFNDSAVVNAFVYNKIKNEFNVNKRDFEGAWIVNDTNFNILQKLNNVIQEASDEIGFMIDLGIDLAASSLFSGTIYCYKNYSGEQRKRMLNRKEQYDFVLDLIKKYNLKYIEDPFYEDDFDSFNRLNQEISDVLICGDDLICTNIERLNKARVNCVIIKPNQIGSLIKTKEIIDYCQDNNITTVMSHRSGETMDKTIAHLAVAWEVPFVKFGVYGKERVVKLYELTRIERLIKNE